MKPYLLLAVICLLSSCKKNNTTTSIPARPSVDYTSGLGGMRKWHGAYGVENTTTTYVTIDTIPDTSFAVTILGDSTIAVLGHMLVFASVDSSKGMISFKKINYLIGMGSLSLVYCYEKDSMSFGYSTYEGNTGRWLALMTP